MNRAVVLVLVIGALVLGRSSPAGACSCLDPGPAALAEQADVVLVGTVVEQEDSGLDEIDDAVRNTVEVERVYVGEADPEVGVLGGETSGGSCEYGFEEGRYLIFGFRDEAGIHTDWCSGTRPLVGGEEVPAELGAGVVPEWPPTGGPDGDVVDDDALGSPLVPIAVGACVVVLAITVVVLRVRRRRPA